MPAEGKQNDHETEDRTLVADLDDAVRATAQDGVEGAGGAIDRAAGDTGDESGDGAVEYDERRAKMERLRAEGVDPYPPVTLWGRRARTGPSNSTSAARRWSAFAPKASTRTRRSRCGAAARASRRCTARTIQRR